MGLPAGYMGNSEVGHLPIGSGRIVYQDMARIDVALETGELAASPVLNDVFSKVQAKGGRVHFMGLLSDAGVHSHIAHLEALLHCAADKGVSALVHAFTDGRDTSPNAGAGFVERLEAVLKSTPKARLASLCGRYYAMDRDNRWDRVELAYNALTKGEGVKGTDAAEAVQASYDDGKTDELAQRLEMRCIIIALLALANEAHKSNPQPMGAKIKNIAAILKDPALKAILSHLDLSEAESRKKLELNLMKREASLALYLYYSLFNRIKAALGKG